MAGKGTRYSEEQIIRILWRNKHGGLETSELQRLRELEAENSRLKRRRRPAAAGHRCPQRGGVKKVVSPRARRTVVERLVTERGLSQRHACGLMSLQRSSARYVSNPRSDEAATVALIREYAHEQPVYGYRIIAAMLKQDGCRINRKRVYHIWWQDGLQLPRRKAP